MPGLQIARIAVGSDNYAYLIHCPATGATAAVDPSTAAPVLRAAAERGWSITHVLATHHHGDHTGGNADLKAATGCQVIGPAGEADRIPALDRALADGETLALGQGMVRGLAVPGHTRGHMAYWLPEEGALFSGDALFSIGCGRLFEGDAAQMWASLERLRALPDATQVYCGHEYTLSNVKFALTVDPDNPALKRRAAEVQALRDRRAATVPSSLAEEKAANPFLRADDPALAARVGLAGAEPARVFAEIRRRKDDF